MASDLAQPLEILPDPLPIPHIPPGVKPFDVTIRPPGSKSITNRALLLAALADGTSTLRGALTDADDAQVMLRAIQQLGSHVEHASGGTGGSPAIEAPDVLRITGVSGRWKIPPGQSIHLNLHNAGTATRFLAAAGLLAPAGSAMTIDGDARMRERPIGELLEAVNTLAGSDAQAEYVTRRGYPPIRIHGLDRTRGQGSDTVRFGRTQSSQFVSAVLLIAPLLPHGLAVEFTDAITSEPYIDMTLGLLRRVGVRVEDHRPTAIRIDPSPLGAFDLNIEPDASGATYFEAAAALLPGARSTIPGLDLGPRGSLQGDTQFVRILTALGAQVERVGGGKAAALRITGPDRLAPIDADLADMPDTAMTAAVLCCFAQPTPDNRSATSTLRGLRTLRVKETDRLAALQTELSKLGARIQIFRDGDDEALRISPPDPSSLSRAAGGVAPSLVFDTYHDHRMAMALALVGLRLPAVQIKNPGCVAKTYPGFWKDLAKLIG